MDIYKSILNAIVEPLTNHDEQQLQEWAIRLKQFDGESWAIGEMLERALHYIVLTLALADEDGPTTRPEGEPSK